jgi:hypothetical protein
MKIFISYAREDEAVAHFVSYVLGLNGMKCLIDVDMESGSQFDIQLQNMIRDSDMILLLLTNASASSPWVNQEIGFAIAHGKTIWPIAIERDIKPHGMISTIQSYSLFDWSEPNRAIDKLVTTLKSSHPNQLEYFKQFGLEHVIRGKVERTRYIVHCLHELIEDQSRHSEIRCQAAFSSFSVSDDPRYDRPGEHSTEYKKLLLQEREAMNEIAKSPRFTLKLILWPVRAYEPEFLSIRFDNLIRWMEDVKNVPSVEFVCVHYPGPNRLIASNQYCIEGFKLHQQSGYGVSIVKHEKQAIDLATKEFDITFQQAGQTKAAAIDQVRKMFHQFVGA